MQHLGQKRPGYLPVIILHNDNDMHHALVDVFGNEESELRSSAIVAVFQNQLLIQYA